MPTGVDSISVFKKKHELRIEPCAVIKSRQAPVVAEYFIGGLVKLFTLAHMEIDGTATDGVVLDHTGLHKAIGYDVRVRLVFI